MLTGTPKQVRQAVSIRADILSGEEEVRAHITAVAEFIPTDQVALAEMALERVRTQTSATWWIDRRRSLHVPVPPYIHLIDLMEAAAKDILGDA